MNKKTIRIVVDCLVIIIGIVFLVLGIKDAFNYIKKPVIDDNIKFTKSYPSISKDNIYKYVDIEEANDILINKSGIILLGKTNDPWMQVLVSPLNDIVKEELDEIYYLEITDENEKNFIPADYDKPVTQIRLENISLPHIYIVKDGKILKELGKNKIIDEEYDGAPIDYFDDEHKNSLKESLKEISELK